MVEDLSRYHQPVSSSVERPRSPAEWETYRLSEEQLAFYREHGYLAGIRVLTGEQVEVLCSELEPLMDPAYEGNHLFYEFHTNEASRPEQTVFHALGAWRIAPAFHDLLWAPAFRMAAWQLLEGPVRFWHDQLFCKPARHGGVVAWHQDYSYWTRTEPLAHLTCWIALDDSTLENGCVHYVPGSHRWELLPITGLVDDMESIQAVLTEEQKAEFRPVAVELKKGECSFHHGLTVHGSYENRSDRPRRAAVINVFRDGVRSVANEPLLEGVPPTPAGEVMSGRFFPLLMEGPR